MSKLAGKVAVVTGASKGIGAGIAKALAAEGAAVVVNYASSKAGADAVVEVITAAGGQAVAVQGDVSKEAEAKALVDAWMNSEGHRKNILLAEAEYLGVSCVGSQGKSEMPVFYCTQVFLAPLRMQRR